MSDQYIRSREKFMEACKEFEDALWDEEKKYFEMDFGSSTVIVTSAFDKYLIKKEDEEC